jgi:hypothetical protein
MDEISPAQQLALWADQLRHVSAQGLHFADNPYDKQHYHHLYQFVFLCEPLSGIPDVPPSHANEVLDVRWFPERALPPDLDPGHVPCIPHAYRVWHGDRTSFFDRGEA